jgi:N-acetylmuramoyl-L-alanine amidase
VDRRRFLQAGLAALAGGALGTTTGPAADVFPGLRGYLARDAQAGPQPVLQRAFVLAVDPGHGGSNTGCTAFDGKTHEKDVTLVLASRLADRVRTLIPQSEVLLTREHDVTMTLAERVGFANEVGANLFLSVHCNASPTRTQQGYETFILDAKASSLDAARTAQRENDEGFAAPPPPATDAGSMVRELEQRAHQRRAAMFAKFVQDEQRTRFPDRLDRGVKQAPFDVLLGARMPAALTEVGFLDHPEEGAWLLDGRMQRDVVDAMARAVVRWYRDVFVRL